MSASQAGGPPSPEQSRAHPHRGGSGAGHEHGNFHHPEQIVTGAEQPHYT